MTDNVVELVSSQQLQQILNPESEVISFIDCYADWCGPCKAAFPMFRDFANHHREFENIKFYKLNIDNPDPDLQQFCQNEQIMYIPLFLIVEKGRVVHKENNIRQLVSSFRIQEKQTV
jgi:thioredoxin 1